MAANRALRSSQVVRHGEADSGGGFWAALNQSRRQPKSWLTPESWTGPVSRLPFISPENQEMDKILAVTQQFFRTSVE
jgi:hypothetical protein